MLNAARVHGSPMIVIAIKIAAITQPAAIHRPPKKIHRRLSKKEKADMAFLRDLGTMGLCWALSLTLLRATSSNGTMFWGVSDANRSPNEPCFRNLVEKPA